MAPLTFKRTNGRILSKMIENFEAYKAKVLKKYGDSDCISLAPLQVPCTGATTPCKNIKQEGNNPMDDKVYYLSSRAATVYNDKVMDLSKQFGLHDDDMPCTPAELVARIQAGKYILPDTAKRRVYGPIDGICWRDPSVKVDEAGYYAAIKALKDQCKITKDIINIKSPDDGLAAVQAFEAWQPTVATTSN